MGLACNHDSVLQHQAQPPVLLRLLSSRELARLPLLLLMMLMWQPHPHSPGGQLQQILRCWPPIIHTARVPLLLHCHWSFTAVHGGVSDQVGWLWGFTKAATATESYKANMTFNVAVSMLQTGPDARLRGQLEVLQRRVHAH